MRQHIFWILFISNFFFNLVASQAQEKMQTNTESLILRDSLERSNPLATYYLSRASAIPLNKGEGFYRNIWGLYNEAQVGITNRFSMGLSALLLPGLEVPVAGWLDLNYSIPTKNEKFHWGLGTFIGSVFVAPYVQGTWGDRNKNISLGAGYVPFTFEFDEGGIGVILLSTSKRIGRKSYFVTDNYALLYLNDAVISSTLAWRKTGKVGFEIGLSLNLVEDDFTPGPWLGFHVPFGNKKSK